MLPRAAERSSRGGRVHHGAEGSGDRGDRGGHPCCRCQSDRDTRAGGMEVEWGNGADVEEVVDQMVTGIDLLYLILQSVFLRPLGV